MKTSEKISELNENLMASPRSLRQEVLYFIFAGIMATATDFILYWCLHHVISYNFAKAISFMAGGAIAYLLNKFITFNQRQRSQKEIIKFILLYTSTLFANVLVNGVTVYALNDMQAYWNFLNTSEIMVLGFLMATGVSTCLNFIGQKFWVFKKEHKS